MPQQYSCKVPAPSLILCCQRAVCVCACVRSVWGSGFDDTGGSTMPTDVHSAGRYSFTLGGLRVWGKGSSGTSSLGLKVVSFKQS